METVRPIVIILNLVRSELEKMDVIQALESEITEVILEAYLEFGNTRKEIKVKPIFSHLYDPTATREKLVAVIVEGHDLTSDEEDNESLGKNIAKVVQKVLASGKKKERSKCWCENQTHTNDRTAPRRTEMKRIWLKVDKLQLQFYQRSEQDLKEKIAWMSVKIGSVFDVNSAYFQSNEGLTQNWPGSPRFLDVPICHIGKRKAKYLLEDILHRAIYEGYLRGEEQKLKAFLEGTRKEEPETPFFKPPDWNNKSLRIPVDFIKLHTFHCSQPNGPVLAHVKTGTHLVFWDVQVYDGKDAFVCRDRSIHDKKVLKVINGLLADGEVRKYLKWVSESGSSPFDMKSFIDKTPDCNTEKIRPVRFY